MSPDQQRPHHGRRFLSASLGAAAVAAFSVTGATAAHAATPQSFPGARPHWAKTSADAGAAPADSTVEGEIQLDLRNAAGATALAKAVSDPASPKYRKYVSAKTWIDRFSPTASDYNQAVKALKQSGATVVATPKSRLFIAFRAPATAVNATFKADMHRYHYRGHVLLAPSKTPTVSSKFGDAVGGIVLDQGGLLTRPSIVSPDGTPAANAKAQRTARPADTTQASLPIPCSDYYGQNQYTLPEALGQTTFDSAICGYNGEQLRSATGIPQGADGKGQTVAIIDAYASPSIVSDVNRLSISRGQTPLTTYKQKIPTTFYDQAACAFPSGWQGEQTLDVQAVHNIAPKANIFYEGGFNCGTGLDVAMSDILDNQRANIVSNSYGNLGEPPLYAVKTNENQHLQAAAEGIGLYFSSGDSGDETVNGLPAQPDYPATSPWVTAVGGTTLGIGKNGSVALQTGWGTARTAILQDSTTKALSYGGPVPGDFVFGAGGGRSGLFGQPWYQKDVVPASLASGQREIPDVSADADPLTGEVIGISPIDDANYPAVGQYTEQTYGGTSLASPLFAATVALAQQKSGVQVGFLNPTIYAKYRKSAASVRDVKHVQSTFTYTSQSTGKSWLVVNDQDTSLKTRNGYDEVTGLGSPTLGQLSKIVKR
ncbi:S53 family peptidase [Jatrophihabitans fulvus]